MESSSLSFPANPNINQTVDFQGKTFSWTGVGWKQITPAFPLFDPAGLVRLAYGSVNNVATLDFVLTSYTTKYRGFIWKFAGMIPVTDGVFWSLRVSTDGGASYDSGASTYHWQVIYAGETGTLSGVGVAADTSIGLTSNAASNMVGNATNEGLSGSVETWKPTNAALWSRFTSQVAFMDSNATSRIQACTGSGARNAAQDTDAVRFLFSSGNIASGDYAMYGGA